MRVPVNAHIMTDAGASVTPRAARVPPATVGQNTDTPVAEYPAAAQPQPADYAVTPRAAPDVDPRTAGLDAGHGPLACPDSTAAGAGAPVPPAWPAWSRPPRPWAWPIRARVRKRPSLCSWAGRSRLPTPCRRAPPWISRTRTTILAESKATRWRSPARSISTKP